MDSNTQKRTLLLLEEERHADGRMRETFERLGFRVRATEDHPGPATRFTGDFVLPDLIVASCRLLEVGDDAFRGIPVIWILENEERPSVFLKARETIGVFFRPRDRKEWEEFEQSMTVALGDGTWLAVRDDRSHERKKETPSEGTSGK